MSNALTNLIQSLLSIASGIINAILSVFQGVFETVVGTTKSVLHLSSDVIAFFWSNFFILLLLGFAILGYQIFVVDNGNAQRTRARMQKKLS